MAYRPQWPHRTSSRSVLQTLNVDGSFERARQTGRSPGAFDADLSPLVLHADAACSVEHGPSQRIAGQHETALWRQREHVRAHAVEFFVRDLDEMYPAIEQPLAKWDRQQS